MIIITQDGRGLNSNKIIEYFIIEQKGGWCIRAWSDFEAYNPVGDINASNFIARYPTLERAVHEMLSLCDMVGRHNLNHYCGVYVMPPEEESEDDAPN